MQHMLSLICKLRNGNIYAIKYSISYASKPLLKVKIKKSNIYDGIKITSYTKGSVMWHMQDLYILNEKKDNLSKLMNTE